MSDPICFKQIVLTMLLIVLAAGCDDSANKKRREAAEAVNKVNLNAAQQCEAKLKGLKRVPIAGTGGKLFLDAERLPMWSVSRGFQPGDDCGAAQLGWGSETFFWTGDDFISENSLLTSGRNSIEAERRNWVFLHADVLLGRPSDCKYAPTPSMQCGKPPPDKAKSGVIRLKNHPLDAWPVRDPRQPDELPVYLLSLRDWPKGNGFPRTMRLSCQVTGLTPDEIEHLDFSGKLGACEIDFYDFKFKAGRARIVFSTKDINEITPILKAFHQYLNDSIIEEK